MSYYTVEVEAKTACFARIKASSLTEARQLAKQEKIDWENIEEQMTHVVPSDFDYRVRPGTVELDTDQEPWIGDE